MKPFAVSRDAIAERRHAGVPGDRGPAPARGRADALRYRVAANGSHVTVIPVTAPVTPPSATDSHWTPGVSSLAVKLCWPRLAAANV